MIGMWRVDAVLCAAAGAVTGIAITASLLLRRASTDPRLAAVDA